MNLTLVLAVVLAIQTAANWWLSKECGRLKVELGEWMKESYKWMTIAKQKENWKEARRG